MNDGNPADFYGCIISCVALVAAALVLLFDPSNKDDDDSLQ